MSLQTKWMYPDQIFVLSGGASANSLFLEDKNCHKIFFDYYHRFIHPMVELLQYKLTASGWVLLIKTKSEKEITNAYRKQRNKSKKADRTKDLKETKRMLSEHFRMFLSNFAKSCNQYLGRNGVWVKKKFEKLAIFNEEEYEKQFELICDLQQCNYRQLKEKYQADEEMYDVDKFLLDKEGMPHVLRSPIGVYAGRVKLERLPVELKIVRPFSDVLRKILIQARDKKNPKNPPPPT